MDRPRFIGRAIARAVARTIVWICERIGRRGPVIGCAALVLATTAATAAATADEAVLIGGSHELHGSRERIELNVRWIGDILRERDVPVTTFFTDGDEAGPDVHYTRPREMATGALEPLARVFGQLELERRRYRNHTLPDVAGTTRRDALESALGDLLARTADAPLLLVHDGHGSRSPDAPADVTLDLWGNTAMSARELHALVGARRGASDAPFRFVFTQCHSGGFHRLAYADPDTGLALADGTRCGFTAVSAQALAEGCGADLDSGDHRGYTTYFFAALADHERDGTVLDRDPDMDANGAVTLREAHLHALEKAHSIDLPRSTSEDWLEAWQPWYLRWLPQPPSPPNNEYARLFRTLALRSDTPLESRIGHTLRERLAGHENLIATRLDERSALRLEADALRARLRNAASARWPALLGPYTDGYRELAASGELAVVSAWLAEAPGHAALVDLQAREDGLERAIIAAGRDATQARKLLRLRRLATLKGQLEDHGSEGDKARYASLLDCEERPLVLGNHANVTAAAD